MGSILKGFVSLIVLIGLSVFLFGPPITIGVIVLGATAIGSYHFGFKRGVESTTFSLKNFDDTKPETEGLTAVMKDEKWGFVRVEDEEVVVECIYSEVMPFQDGIAAFLSNDGKWGFINKNGNEIIRAQYSNIYTFTNGMALVVKDDKYGAIDVNGKIVCPIEYKNALGYSEELCAVQSQNGKWGFVDKEGSIIIDLMYDGVSPFEDGVATVIIGDESQVIKNPIQLIH